MNIQEFRDLKTAESESTKIDYSKVPTEFQDKANRIKFAEYFCEGHYFPVYSSMKKIKEGHSPIMINGRKDEFLEKFGEYIELDPTLLDRLENIWTYCREEIKDYTKCHKKDILDVEDSYVLSFKEKIVKRILHPLEQPFVVIGYIAVPIIGSIFTIITKDVRSYGLCFLFWTIVGIPAASVLRELEIERNILGKV